MTPAHGTLTQPRRLFWERAIWGIDMAAYLFLAVSGYFAAFAPSEYVRELVQVSWVISLWGCLLFGGGVVAFLGRLTRHWAVEFVANVFAAWGAVLYAVILIPAVLDGSSVAVFGVVMVGWLFVFRRYAELRIFTTEPGLDSFRKRLDAALRRRTENVVPRHSL